MDSTAYKAFRATIYYNNGESTNFGSDALFYINNGVMLTPGEGQLKKFRFIETPRPADIGEFYNSGYEIPLSLDDGGHKCQIYFMYTPKDYTRDKNKDVYSIIISYSNLMFFFQCHKTDERPWDNNPKYVDEMIEEQNKFPENPDYTDEEIREFFKTSESTDSTIRIIENTIKRSLIPDLSEF